MASRATASCALSGTWPTPLGCWTGNLLSGWFQTQYLRPGIHQCTHCTLSAQVTGTPFPLACALLCYSDLSDPVLHRSLTLYSAPSLFCNGQLYSVLCHFITLFCLVPSLVCTLAVLARSVICTLRLYLYRTNSLYILFSRL